METRNTFLQLPPAAHVKIQLFRQSLIQITMLSARRIMSLELHMYMFLQQTNRANLMVRPGTVR
ncbi:hypothetical protein CAK78_06335 [Aeromonas sp. A35_P]|nr:hypothetical protein CAK78_06335 [Aeromonas sp. A35_P]